MVTSLTKSIPFIVSAIRLVGISGDIVHSNVEKCISLQTRTHFNLRAIIADNHPTNISAYKLLRKLHGIHDSDHVISNPYIPRDISGYISHRLLKDASCSDCVNLLQQRSYTD